MGTWLLLCGKNRKIQTQDSCLFISEGIVGLSRTDVGECCQLATILGDGAVAGPAFVFIAVRQVEHLAVAMALVNGSFCANRHRAYAVRNALTTAPG